MLSALCGSSSWRDYFVQIAAVSILFGRPDGDAIAVLFSISNLNPNFPLKRFQKEVLPYGDIVRQSRFDTRPLSSP